MIKKIALVLLCLVMVVGCLAACNKNEPEVTDPTVDTSVNENPTEEATDPVEDPTDDATEPTDDVVEAPVVDQKIKDVFTTVQENMGETYRATMEIPAEMLNEMFALDAASYENALGMMPMISAHVDTLVGVKATDAEAVKTAFEAYIEAKKADRMQYPTNAAAMGAMKVVTVGDYVWLVGVFGDIDSVAEQGDEAILKFAQDTVATIEATINEKCAG